MRLYLIFIFLNLVYLAQITSLPAVTPPETNDSVLTKIKAFLRFLFRPESGVRNRLLSQIERNPNTPVYVNYHDKDGKVYKLSLHTYTKTENSEDNANQLMYEFNNEGNEYPNRGHSGNLASINYEYEERKDHVNESDNEGDKNSTLKEENDNKNDENANKDEQQKKRRETRYKRKRRGWYRKRSE
uniref:Hypothetical secreted protein n=1 Tax=Glossina morsitans morsitans TaxID=37546 RepID=D3TSQ1_GLOMM